MGIECWNNIELILLLQMKFDFFPKRIGRKNPNLQDYRYSPIIGNSSGLKASIFDQDSWDFMIVLET